eukprot:Pgem_evm1s7557
MKKHGVIPSLKTFEPLFKINATFFFEELILSGLKPTTETYIYLINHNIENSSLKNLKYLDQIYQASLTPTIGVFNALMNSAQGRIERKLMADICEDELRRLPHIKYDADTYIAFVRAYVGRSGTHKFSKSIFYTSLESDNIVFDTKYFVSMIKLFSVYDFEMVLRIVSDMEMKVGVLPDMLIKRAMIEAACDNNK